MLGNAEIVKNALREHVTIPAFNVPYLPMIEPVIRAVADQDSFAFIASARPEWIKFEAKGPDAVMAEYKKWERPEYVRMHLDHVPVIDEDNEEVDYVPIIEQAIALGYHSVMVDGSRLDLDGNIEATRCICELAHKAGIPCEAELGAVLGHEEGPLPPYEELFASGKGFTDVDAARRFVEETGCDWLSVAVGNIHGAISVAQRDKKKVAARLNLEHLDTLREATGVPLVLHGGSGVQREYMLEGVKRGIAKINIGTEIRQAYEMGMREAGSVADGQEAVYQRTCELIKDYFGLAGTRAKVAG